MALLPRSRRQPVRIAADGRAYLNVGSGAHGSPEWNNVDVLRAPGVVRHDLRRPLPYDANRFDAVYASHVLEHFDPDRGLALLVEMRRVASPGAPVRIVVPDLERICRDYLARLSEAVEASTPEARRRLAWMRIELLDQMVRTRSGGRMLAAIASGEVDPAEARARLGDELAAVIDAGGQQRPGAVPRPRAMLAKVAANALARWRTPARTGELHRWMYDRVSLAEAMTAAGLRDVRQVAHDQSSIPAWERWALDTSRFGPGPRKPDSLYMEGRA